jgi:molybdopterin converting factor small subunit
MPVTFHVPGYLRSFTAGQAEVRLDASPATVRDALEALWVAYPGVRDRVVTEQGMVRQHVNVFLGNENIRWTGWLDTPVPPGSEISIVPAVSGG